MATHSMPRLATPNEAMRDFIQATRRDKARFAASTTVLLAAAVANVVITYFWWVAR